MSVSQINAAIKGLPLEECPDVISFAHQYEATPKLTPEELAALGERLADATDPGEIASLKKAMLNGFYGVQFDA